MPEGDDFLKTIEAVHAAALDEARWTEALGAVAHLFGSAAASYEQFDKRSIALTDFHTFGVPPAGEIAYLEYYARNNPRAAYAFSHPAHDMLYDRVLIDERGMDRDPYYVKYLGELGLRYFLTGKLADTADTHAIISIQRSRREGHVERADIARMRRLLPHLRQAYDVATRLRDARARASALQSALDWIGDGALLVRADGLVLYANEAAQTILRRRDGVRIARGRIDFAFAAARAQFERAVGQVARLRGGDAAEPAADFVAPRGTAPAYLVSVRPLLRGQRGSAPAAAIVFIHDPMRQPASRTALLRMAFGFTEAEAALADAIRSGMAPAQYARTRTVSPNTVYTHLRRIKDKAGCKRVGELTRRLNDVCPSVRGV
jgi:DNA-binding CsgD family transcriptional regulator/PAS domain-containing protein